MWIFTRQSFVSIVQHRDDPALLLVRARRAGDISTLWPDAKVDSDPTADYRYRATIQRDKVAERVARCINDIDYVTDFKGGVKENRRHDAYMRVWSAMSKFQSGEET